MCVFNEVHVTVIGVNVFDNYEVVGFPKSQLLVYDDLTHPVDTCAKMCLISTHRRNFVRRTTPPPPLDEKLAASKRVKPDDAQKKAMAHVGPSRCRSERERERDRKGERNSDFGMHYQTDRVDLCTIRYAPWNCLIDYSIFGLDDAFSGSLCVGLATERRFDAKVGS